MAGRTVHSFPNEFALILIRAITEQTLIRIPCETHGQEVNLAVRLRHYCKILRHTPIEELTAGHLQARQLLNSMPVHVIGGSRNRNRPVFCVIVKPYDPADDPIAKALEGWAPPVAAGPQGVAEVPNPGFAHPTGLNAAPRTDSELLDIARQANPVAMRLLSSAQRSRMEELMLGVQPEPGRVTH